MAKPSPSDRSLSRFTVGSTTGLLGGNGAGKTTIGMIMGLIGLTSGSIHTFGHDMAHERHQVLGHMNSRAPTWTCRIALLWQKSARLRVALARILAETKFEF
jgi:ABC-type uncharacterized transport system ATPase subunit